MRILLAATIAASALAIGASTVPATSLPPGGWAADPGAVQKVQQTLPSPSQEGGKMRSEERGRTGPQERGSGRRENGSRTGQQPRGYIDGGREWRGGKREWRGGDREFRRGYRGDRGEWRGRGWGYRRDCGWLRRRALETGSRYWWRRFRDCVR